MKKIFSTLILFCLVLGPANVILAEVDPEVPTAAELETALNQLGPEGYTPLQNAVFAGDSATVNNMIKDGADVSMLSDLGETALHLTTQTEAGMADAIAMARSLIEAGADVNARDLEFGMTPLYFAEKPLAEVLVEAGARIDVKSKAGLTPVQWLAYSNAADEIEYLISLGADVNYKDSKDGKSALAIAANWGHLQSAEVLLKHGAEVDAPDRDGWRPLQWAAFEGGQEMEQFLLEHGAKPLSDAEYKEIMSPGDYL